MDKITNINDFAAYVKESILPSFPDCRIETSAATKNNGVRLTGITIHPQDSGISPTICLHKHFADFQNDRPITDIMQEITRDCRVALDGNAMDININVDNIRDFAFARDKICFKLISKELNCEMLQNVPHRDFLDLAVVYYLQLSVTDKGTSTVTITDSLARRWDVDEAQLYELARKNTPAIHRGCVMPLDDVLEECLGASSQSGRNCIPHNGFDFTVSRNPGLPMYVATNKGKFYGASVILYDGLLDAVAEKTGGFYILPSSIHEIIIVPDTFGDPEYLAQMVMDVNRADISPDAVLSDNCYHYSLENHTLEIVS